MLRSPSPRKGALTLNSPANAKSLLAPIRPSLRAVDRFRQTRTDHFDMFLHDQRLEQALFQVGRVVSELAKIHQDIKFSHLGHFEPHPRQAIPNGDLDRLPATVPGSLEDARLALVEIDLHNVAFKEIHAKDTLNRFAGNVPELGQVEAGNR